MNTLARNFMRSRICTVDRLALDARQMPTFAHKVRAYRRRIGMDQGPFADFIGVSQATVSRWESGRQRPSWEQIARLAQLSQTEVSYWLEDDAPDFRARAAIRVKVVGNVDGGKFRESIEWPPEEQYEIEIPSTSNFAKQDLKAFVVRGPSMNRVYPENSFVIVMPTIANGIKPLSGARVIVQSRDKSGMYEATIKEYIVDENGREWLWPRSRNPEHQTPIPLQERYDRGEFESVEIIGIVVGSYNIEPLDRIMTSGKPKK